MYLKSIELSGFKSFADKTLLTFEPGITSVVGPNGSGKSNISDAICWVMGEMSAKSLRGSNMQDVIFSGTQKRKPLGFAEVCLTLDNQDHIFPVEFDEVSVTRRVYRSGESEYYINRSPCRLKDIHELFMDTGLGRDGYAIIGQGRVNEIISGKSEERRSIFDEAAGISKYRHRKEEAERKLAHTQENLVRILDIKTELETQLEPLRQQSQKAKQYLDLREETKELEVNLFLDAVEKNKQNMQTADTDFETVMQQLSQLQQEMALAEAEIARLESYADEQDRLLEESRTRMSDAELLIKGYTGEIELLNNSIASNDKLVDRVVEELQKLRKDTVSCQEKQKELLDQKKAAISQHALQTEEMNSVKQAFDRLNQQYIEDTAHIGKSKAEIIEKLNVIASLKAELGSLEAFKKSFADRKEAIERQQLDTNSEQAKLTAMQMQLKERLSTAAQAKQEGEKQLAEAQQLLKRLQEENQTRQSEQNRLTAEYGQRKTRLQMLLEMERELEGFGKSTKSVLNASKSGALPGCTIYGTVSSLIEVDKKYAVALEMALGPALQNIVTQTEQDAKIAITYLKSQRAGRVTFLPVSAVQGRSLPEQNDLRSQTGYIGLASEIITYDRKFDGIVKNLLGRTVIVDTMDHGIAMSRRYSYRFRIVTLEGEILNAGGAITGGSVNKTAGLLSRQSEIKQLRQETERLQSEIALVQIQASQSAEKYEQQEKMLSQLEYELQQLQQEQIRLQADFEHGKTLLETIQTSYASAENELKQIEEQIQQTNDDIAVLINRSTREEFEIEAMKEQAAEREASFAKLDAQKNALSEKIHAANLQLHAISRDISHYEAQLAEAKDNEAKIRTEAAQKRADIDQFREKNVQLRNQIVQKRQTIEQTADTARDLDSKAAGILAERDSARKQAKEYLEGVRLTREKVFLLKEEQGRIDNKRTKLASELENMSARIWDEYELTYTGAQAYRKPIVSTAASQRRVNELKNQMKQLGNVNIDAITEYNTVRDRYEFLSGQLADLTAAKESLAELIESIQSKMKKQFAEQFAIINGHFSETFAQLFGGGRASLRLIEPTDVLGSDIEIEAQPPGKTLRSLSLLSGGEMAFTAIALLFAILKVRPTPFCVLDEIEAALDEPNVYRFAEYLKKYCSQTQFILITHRRGTMEAADLLYGVTMQEKGVSKLLALKLDEAQSLSRQQA